MREISVQEIALVSGGQDTVTVTGEFVGGGFGSGTISISEVAGNMYTTFVDAFDSEESAGLQTVGMLAFIEYMLTTSPLEGIGDALSTPTTSVPAGVILGSVNLDGDYFAELLLIGDTTTGYALMYIDSDNDNAWDRVQSVW